MSPFAPSPPDILAGVVIMAVCVIVWVIVLTDGGHDK